MATFVELDSNNKIINVIKVSDEDCGGGIFPESEAIGIAYLREHFGADRIWKQGSINRNFRHHRPTVGGTYDPELDIFLLPKPRPGFVLDENFFWIPPVPRPDDDTQPYRYMDLAKTWVPIPKPYPSWIVRGKKPMHWVPPISMPTDGKKYIWDESVINWVEVTQ